MLQLAICDDNADQLDALFRLLDCQCTEPHTIERFTNPQKLLDYLVAGGYRQIQALFLDICLGDQNGIKIAQKIQNSYPLIKIVFVSGYLQYACEIFDAEPSYFLSKPLQEDRVTAALKRVQQLIELQNKQYLSLDTKYGLVRILLANIAYIESRNKILFINQMNEAVVEVRSTLDHITPQLPSCFLRCHHSYIVNMQMIHRFDQAGILLADGCLIPVSRPKFAHAKEQFRNYLGASI